MCFLSFTFLHIRDSHYATPDVATTLPLTLSLYFALQAAQQDRSTQSLFLSSLFAGIAAGVKYVAGFAVITTTVSAVLLVRQHIKSVGSDRKDSLQLVWQTSALILLGTGIGFAIGAPGMVLHPLSFLADFGEYFSRVEAGFGPWEIDSAGGYVFYLKTLMWGAGYLLTGTVMLSILVVVTCPNRYRILLLSFPLCYLLFMGRSHSFFGRYLIPCLPYFALMAADAVTAVVNKICGSSQLKDPLLWTAVAIVMAQPLIQSIRHDLILCREDTRTQAKQWIEAHLPEGARIAVDWLVHGPPLATLDQDAPLSRRRYDVTIVRSTGLSEHSIEYYQEQGFDYLIASSFIYNIPLRDKGQAEARRAFYASLDSELEMLREFRPDSEQEEPPFVFDQIYGPATSLFAYERPGPILKIYQVSR